MDRKRVREWREWQVGRRGGERGLCMVIEDESGCVKSVKRLDREARQIQIDRLIDQYRYGNEYMCVYIYIKYRFVKITIHWIFHTNMSELSGIANRLIYNARIISRNMNLNRYKVRWYIER